MRRRVVPGVVAGLFAVAGLLSGSGVSHAGGNPTSNPTYTCTVTVHGHAVSLRTSADQVEDAVETMGGTCTGD